MKIANSVFFPTILVLLIVLYIDGVVFCTSSDSTDPNAGGTNDPNTGALMQFESEAKKITYLAEAVYWPDFDYKNVIGNISEPNSIEKAKFTKLVSQIAEPNYLPEGLAEKICFLKGWRGADNENFVVQYEKQPYLIRIKTQTTTVIASRKWTSHWITMVIQLKDKTSCVNKSDSKDILTFTDRFLTSKVNSSAQNYGTIKNMDGTIMTKARFTPLDGNYFLAYHVGASHPDIDGVTIWTDGYTVIINLQERRKVILPPTE